MARDKFVPKKGKTSIQNRGAITKPKPKARSARKPSVPSPQPNYTPKRYPTETLLQFKNHKAWDEKKFVGNIKSISFGWDFNIEDKHLDAIVAAGPEFCNSICSFNCGDSRTGNGSRLSDAAISRLTAACPNLVRIDVDSARYLTDAALLAICRNCPNIEDITINGNDKIKGQISGTALDVLRADKKLAKELRVLDLQDQGTSFEKAVKALSKARKKLEITMGDTNKWGGGTIDTYRGGKTGLNYSGGKKGIDYTSLGGFGRWR